MSLLRTLLISFALLIPILAPRPAAAGDIDPEALVLVHGVCDQIIAAQTLFVRVTFDLVSDDAGTANKQTNQIQIAARRPNLYTRIIRKDGIIQEIRSSNGTNVSNYLKQFDAYETIPAPGTYEELFAGDSVARSTLVSLMLTPAGYDFLMGGVKELKPAGERQVDGVTCRVLAFEDAEGTGEMVIQTTPVPLLRRYRLTLHDSPVTVSIAYDSWDIDPKLGGELFDFTAPEGARKVEALSEIVDEQNRVANRNKHPLLNQPAPDLELTLLSGEPFRLSEAKGRNVVILDFWATWCAPCHESLPILAELADGLADRGVVLYAVNIGEKEDVVRRFMRKQTTQFLVPMDPNSSSSQLFAVGPIPMTVIIDKEGIVRFVHIGVNRDYKKMMTRALLSIIGT